MKMRLLRVALIAAAILISAASGRVAHAGACIRTTCKCDDDCASVGLKCSKQGSEMLCCGGLTPTPCQSKPDGGAPDGGARDGGASGGGSDGCTLAGSPNQGLPTGLVVAGIVVVWAVRTARGRRQPSGR